MSWWKRTADDPTAAPAPRRRPAHSDRVDRTDPAEHADRATPVPQPPAAAPAFDVVRRGYDRAEVDAATAEVEHPLSGRPLPGPGQPPALAPAKGFTIVRRGYDRGQVDAWFTAAAARFPQR